MRQPDSIVNDAHRLAVRAHAGQVDALGRDYAAAHLAPIAAGCATFGPLPEAAGWLHDIIEDTDHTTGSLAGAGFPLEVVAAVDACTKRPGEPYADLITRACADALGRVVKLVDNAWNIACNPLLADRTRAERMLEEKYLPARERLFSAVRGQPGDSDKLGPVLEVFREQLGHLLGSGEQGQAQ